MLFDMENLSFVKRVPANNANWRVHLIKTDRYIICSECSPMNYGNESIKAFIHIFFSQQNSLFKRKTLKITKYEEEY